MRQKLLFIFTIYYNIVMDNNTIVEAKAEQI